MLCACLKISSRISKNTLQQVSKRVLLDFKFSGSKLGLISGPNFACIWNWDGAKEGRRIMERTRKGMYIGAAIWLLPSGN